MYILRENNVEILRNKDIRLIVGELKGRNSVDVDMQIWVQAQIKEKKHRKNGKVRHTGTVCKQLTRYIHSPVGVTGIKFNLSPEEKSRARIHS